MRSSGEMKGKERRKAGGKDEGKERQAKMETKWIRGEKEPNV